MLPDVLNVAKISDVLLPEQFYIFKLQSQLRKTAHIVHFTFHSHELLNIPTGLCDLVSILPESDDDVWTYIFVEEHIPIYRTWLIFTLFASQQFKRHGKTLLRE